MVAGRSLHLGPDGTIDMDFAWLITMGDNVTIAPRVTIVTHDASTRLHLGVTRLAPVTIGDRVFIGAGSIILPGVRIGDDAIVGAGTVVNRDVKPRTVVAGNPVREVCGLDEFLERQRARMATAVRYREPWPPTRGERDRHQAIREELAGREGYCP